MRALSARPLPDEYALFCWEFLACDDSLPCSDGGLVSLDALQLVPDILTHDPTADSVGVFPGVSLFPGAATFPGGQFFMESAGLFPGATTYPGSSTLPGSIHFLSADPVT